MTTILTMPPDKLSSYLRGALEREAARQAAMAERRAMALVAARRVAAVLQERLDATRVVVFGSLVRGGFDEASDIDMVVEGSWLWVIGPARALPGPTRTRSSALLRCTFLRFSPASSADSRRSRNRWMVRSWVALPGTLGCSSR